MPMLSLEEQWQRALAAQMPSAPKPTTSIHEEVVAERRRRNLIANRKYRHTEKGRERNRIHCHKYYVKNKPKFMKAVAHYKEKFAAFYGIEFSTWDYWRRKILSGKCQSDDIPEIYGKILHDWLAKGKKGYGFTASTEQANQ